MMDVTITTCSNHCAIHISQIIALYTLNLYSVVGQLSLNKTGGNNMYIFILVVVTNLLPKNVPISFLSTA